MLLRPLGSHLLTLESLFLYTNYIEERSSLLAPVSFAIKLA